MELNLFKQNGVQLKTIEWKVGRAVFSLEKKKPRGILMKAMDRVALVYNLMTKNVKKVYKIEKKNYLLGLLRWKLNPYLYRFFKIII